MIPLRPSTKYLISFANGIVRLARTPALEEEAIASAENMGCNCAVLDDTYAAIGTATLGPDGKATYRREPWN